MDNRLSTQTFVFRKCTGIINYHLEYMIIPGCFELDCLVV